jgi:hypothetical protein
LTGFLLSKLVDEKRAVKALNPVGKSEIIKDKEKEAKTDQLLCFSVTASNLVII